MTSVAATHLIVILLLILLLGTAITIVRMRDLWAAVMLTGIYSFLGASWMLLLDAPDVAFTEAAVGAGIATFLMLGTLALTSRTAKPPSGKALVPLVVVIVTGAALIYGTFDMPYYGDPEAPVHQHLAPEFLNDTVPHVQDGVSKVGVPNIITAVLASYRGYDTLGETVVIFTAGIGVLLLMRRRRDGNEETDA
jgi:multicomponent Na+:H+ antiporter subunit B